MADGWRCPECGLILGPHVNEHRCDPPDAGVSVRPVVAPYEPSSGGFTVTPGGFTVTPGDTCTTTVWTSGGGGGGGYVSSPGDSVTVTGKDAGAPHPRGETE